MSKRGKEFSDYVQNSQKKNRSLKDETLEKKVTDIIFRDEKAKQRLTAFRKSKIEDAKLKKLIQNKYDIIISENSAQIMATLGSLTREDLRGRSHRKGQGTAVTRWNSGAHQARVPPAGPQVCSQKPQVSSL